jgi:hypothetical protein
MTGSEYPHKTSKTFSTTRVIIMVSAIVIFYLFLEPFMKDACSPSYPFNCSTTRIDLQMIYNMKWRSGAVGAGARDLIIFWAIVIEDDGS